MRGNELRFPDPVQISSLSMPLEEPRKWLGMSFPAWCGIFAMLGLLAGLFYFLINLGPRKVENLQLPMAMNGDQARLSRQIDEIEQRYLRLSPLRLPPANMEQELAQAIQWQGQLLRVDPHTDPDRLKRLNRLQVAKDTVRARLVWDRVEKLENDLVLEGGGTERIAALVELLQLRREINRSRALARYKDLVREAQLERDLEAVQAEPMRQQVEETVIQAEAAMALKDWAHALDLYQRAGALIEEINQLFARSRYADIGLRNRLKSEENSLQGAAELAEIEVLVVGGDAVAFERSELAAEYYQRAITLQQSLNEQWSQSRFFSTTRLEQLTEKLQTVLSRDLIATMKREDEALTGLLAGRQLLVARAKITALELLGLQLVQELPKSRLSDEGLGRKCRYLSAVGDSIRELQDDVYDQLIPLPKDKAVMLMKGEVTQGLYARVMKFNPSRNLGDALSVDSLSWYETQEFCLRLSWILGLQVRLPLRDEVLNALGDGRKSFVEKSVVTSTDAVLVGQSRELYSDLEGNLAEWLWAESGTDDAWVLAGQVDPKLGAAGTAPFVLLLKKTRSREIGFRVFVQFSEP